MGAEGRVVRLRQWPKAGGWNGLPDGPGGEQPLRRAALARYSRAPRSARSSGAAGLLVPLPRARSLGLPTEQLQPIPFPGFTFLSSSIAHVRATSGPHVHAVQEETPESLDAPVLPDRSAAFLSFGFLYIFFLIIIFFFYENKSQSGNKFLFRLSFVSHSF